MNVQDEYGKVGHCSLTHKICCSEQKAAKQGNIHYVFLLFG